MGVVYAVQDNDFVKPDGEMAVAGGIPLDLLKMSEADRNRFYDGHWHVWPARPWYQIRISRNPNRWLSAAINKWERRPSTSKVDERAPFANPAPVYFPPRSVPMEWDPDAYDTDGQVSREARCPGLTRRLVFKWMADADGAPLANLPLDALSGGRTWSPTERLAYPESTSGTNQPEECYYYELHKDYTRDDRATHVGGRFFPSDPERMFFLGEDAQHPLLKQGGDPAQAKEELRAFLAKGWRTPRNFEEEKMWHLDDRPGKQQAEQGCLRKLAFRKQRSQRFFERRGRVTTSKPQMIELRHPYYETRGPFQPSGIETGRMLEQAAEQDIKVVMVDISHLLANPTHPWRLFEDRDTGARGILPAFQQRLRRKVQVHTLMGGMNRERLTAADKIAFEARAAMAARNASEQLAGRELGQDEQGVDDAAAAAVAARPDPQLRRLLQQRNAKAAAAAEDDNDTGFKKRKEAALAKIYNAKDRVRQKVKQERKKNGEASVSPDQERARVAAAAQKAMEDYVERKPETLTELIWRPKGMGDTNLPGSTRFTTAAHEALIAEWRAGRVAAYEATPVAQRSPHGPFHHKSGGQVAPPIHLQKLEAKMKAETDGAAVVTWPLLRRTPSGIDGDTGVDISTIPTTEERTSGAVPTLLSPDEVNDNNMKVVTFATLQSAVPTPTWEQYVPAEQVTAGVIDKYNRWYHGGGVGGGGGVPCYWKLANLEFQYPIKAALAGTAQENPPSVGVAKLFDTPEMRQAVVDYENQRRAYEEDSAAYNEYLRTGGYPQLVAEYEAVEAARSTYVLWYNSLPDSTERPSSKLFTPGATPLPPLSAEQWNLLDLPPITGDWVVHPPTPPDSEAVPRPWTEPVPPPEPCVTGGKMKAGVDGHGQSYWLDVELKHLREPIMREVVNLLTESGMPNEGPPNPGLSTFGFMQNSDKQNNCFIVPYALYKAEDFASASDNDAQERQRRDIVERARAAEERERQQLAGAQAQRAAQLAAEQQAAATREEEAARQAAQARRAYDEMRQQRKAVADWRSTRTVAVAYPSTTPGGSPIRNLSDRDWWRLYREGADVVKPYPHPTDRDAFDGLNGDGLRGNGIRFESSKKWNRRLQEWHNELDQDIKLPWPPERHEAPFDLYAKLAGQQLQMGCVPKLIGDRGREDTEAQAGNQSFREFRCANWSQWLKRCEQVRQAAKDKAEQVRRDRDAYERALRDQAQRDRAAAAAAAAAAAQQPDEEMPAADEEMPAATPDLDDPEDAERLLEQLSADQDGTFAAAIGAPTDEAVHSVHWRLFGPVGMGTSGSDDMLCRRVAAASKEEMLAMLGAATPAERHALVMLHTKGTRLRAQRA